MPQAKSKNKVGLGNSLMNDRFGRGGRTSQHKASHGITRIAQDGTEYKINDREEAAWVKMRSVTEQGDLDEFLANAELAGTDFTAERITGTKILHVDQKNPYLLTAKEERAITRKHNENRGALTVPRRPPWNESTTPHQLDEMERESLLNWRRSLADLQENKDLLMTPFERNIEVWRQLWRVSERSDLVVQIVDARNPLLYRSEDLERYVKEIDKRKENLLLVNKADLLTTEQRGAWADYFESNGIKFKFFSAMLASGFHESSSDETEEGDEDEQQEEDGKEKEDGDEFENDNDKDAREAAAPSFDDYSDMEDNTTTSGLEDGTARLSLRSQTRVEAGKTQILTVDELEELFLQSVPLTAQEKHSDSETKKITIGLVGYPNVGKSSTINALVGAKKVSVSSTPGKTKHFQTIHLSEKVILCDCPGLVFPNFASTKAELVVNGVLPIDQQREFIGPSGLVAQRIPKLIFENVYGFKVRMRPIEEGGTGLPTANEILTAYAKLRGFSAQNKSGWDTSRAARVILKDYVNGKLLWCTPPPREPPWDEREWNKELYDPVETLRKYQEKQDHDKNKFDSSRADDRPIEGPSGGSKSQTVDKGFFENPQGNAGHLNMPFSYKYSEQGRQLSGRKAKVITALENGVDPDENARIGKKHFKGNKRTKQRKLKVEEEYD